MGSRLERQQHVDATHAVKCSLRALIRRPHLCLDLPLPFLVTEQVTNKLGTGQPTVLPFSKQTWHQQPEGTASTSGGEEGERQPQKRKVILPSSHFARL